MVRSKKNDIKAAGAASHPLSAKHQSGDAVVSSMVANAADGNSGKFIWRNINETLHQVLK